MAGETKDALKEASAAEQKDAASEDAADEKKDIAADKKDAEAEESAASETEDTASEKKESEESAADGKTAPDEKVAAEKDNASASEASTAEEKKSETTADTTKVANASTDTKSAYSEKKEDAAATEKAGEEKTDEFVVEDARKEATALTADQPLVETIGHVDRNIATTYYYSYTPKTDGYFTITVEEAPGNETTYNVSWFYIHDIHATTYSYYQDEWDHSNCTSKSTSERICVAKGTTTRIGVAPHANDTKVKITINQVSSSNWEKESNASSSRATEVNNNHVYGTSLCGGNASWKDVDWFKFNVPSHKSVSMKMDAGSGDIHDGWWFYIYKDLNEDPIYSSGQRKSSFTSKTLDLRSGTYYIKVEPEYDAPEDVPYHLTLNMSKPPKTPVTMYRMYNPNSGEHFYTAETGERDSLISVGWKYEGSAWTAVEESDTPVYRMYNPNAGDHHYTTNKDEVTFLKTAGWNYEGIGWYADDDKTVPVYRAYNPNAVAGAHNYTTNLAEQQMLISVGWKDEGIGFYEYK